jgi:hypothetical protein
MCNSVLNLNLTQKKLNEEEEMVKTTRNLKITPRKNNKEASTFLTIILFLFFLDSTFRFQISYGGDHVELKAVVSEKIAVTDDNQTSELQPLEGTSENNTENAENKTIEIKGDGSAVLGAEFIKYRGDNDKDHIYTFRELVDLYDETSVPVVDHVPKCLAEARDLLPSVVLMSLGRSGSTLIWLMLSQLTGSSSIGATKELVGRNREGTLYFFDTDVRAAEKLKSKDEWNTGHILRLSKALKREIPGKDSGQHGKWMINYCCRLQRERPGGLVGFKWKPTFAQFPERREARESLQLLASLASMAVEQGMKPPVVVVRSRRNMFDVRLSYVKHEGNSDIRSRCEKGDEDCVNSHKRKLFVPDVNDFYRSVNNMWKQENMIDDMLHAINVPMVSVDYDKLFYPDQISDGEDEWNRMIQFVAPSAPIATWQDILNSMEMESTTSSRKHSDKIENWEEVYERFRGTELEFMLRP